MAVIQVESWFDGITVVDLQKNDEHKYGVYNAFPRQPGPWIFYVYCVHSHKNGCYSIPTTARIKAIKVSVKT